MTALFHILWVWLIFNLGLTLFLFQGWYYERRSQPDSAHLEGGSTNITFGRAWLAIARETLVFMWMQICYPYAWWHDRNQPTLPKNDDSTPVLLVHGFVCNSSCMVWLRRQLQKAGYKRRTIKDELRENLIAKLRSGETIFPGIIGYEDTVVPQIVNAVLSRQNFILLGLRGQAKSRILRALTALLDEHTPYIAGCEIRDNPYHPLCARCRDRR